MSLDFLGKEISAHALISHTAQILWRHGGVGVLDVIPISWVSHPRFQTDMVIGHLASVRLGKHGCWIGCKSKLVSACGWFHLLVRDEAFTLDTDTRGGQWCMFESL